MTACLLDVNVLIALTWPTHVHHARARAWFEGRADSSWATCPLTELGFVRVSANPRIIADAVTPREAIAVLQDLRALPCHVFWPDTLSVEPSGPLASLSLVGHRQTTDAYLLALARANDGMLATLDAGLAGLLPVHAARRGWVEVL